jgi:hypothetical protein
LDGMVPRQAVIKSDHEPIGLCSRLKR